MKITLFTSNRPRHLSLIERLAQENVELFVVQECHTLFPGVVPDLYLQSPTMQEYFRQVTDAESRFFGHARFLPSGLRQLSLRRDDLALAPREWLATALDADLYLLFGCSYLTGWLGEFLFEQPAFNLHMGISPYYRGSSSNFWALYDGRLDCVGATVHKVTRSLDAGPVLFHALPKAAAYSWPDLGMASVASAIEALGRACAGTSPLLDAPTVLKNPTIRYTRHRDFTDEVARQWLGNKFDPHEALRALNGRSHVAYVNPRFF